MRLLLLAAPGAGKGTQGSLLAGRLGIRHISSGDALRRRAQEDGDAAREINGHLLRGDLVPDGVVLTALAPVLALAAAAGGYILDGFPRTLPQAAAAEALPGEQALRFDAVIHLAVPESVLVERLLQRARRERRPDDTEPTIRYRLNLFDVETSPLIDHYRQRDKLIVVDGDRVPALVAADILLRLPTPSVMGGPS